VRVINFRSINITTTTNYTHIRTYPPANISQQNRISI